MTNNNRPKSIEFYTGAHAQDRNKNVCELFTNNRSFFEARNIKSINDLKTVLEWSIHKGDAYVNRKVVFSPSFSVHYVNRHLSGYSITCQGDEELGAVCDNASPHGFAALFAITDMTVSEGTRLVDKLNIVVDELANLGFWEAENAPNSGICVTTHDRAVSLLNGINAPDLNFVYVKTTQNTFDPSISIEAASQRQIYTSIIEKVNKAIELFVVDTNSGKRKPIVTTVWNTEFNNVVSTGSEFTFYNDCYPVNRDWDIFVPIRNPQLSIVHLVTQSGFWGSGDAVRSAEDCLNKMKNNAKVPDNLYLAGFQTACNMQSLNSNNDDVDVDVEEQDMVHMNNLRYAILGEGNVDLITPTPDEIERFECSAKYLSCEECYDYVNHLLRPMAVIVQFPHYRLCETDARQFVDVHKFMKCERISVSTDLSDVILYCLEEYKKRGVSFKRLAVSTSSDHSDERVEDSNRFLESIIFEGSNLY